MTSSWIPHAGGDESLCRAFTDEGIELPVIDVTHSAFRLDLDQEQLAAEMERSVAAVRAHAAMPAGERHAHMQGLVHGSFLAARIAQARGKVLGGMATYFLKLGPDNLGAYAGPVDRTIAASMPCLSCRIRLQNMAWLTSQALEPRLAEHPGRTLRLLNIAGGPGMDSLNALVILRRTRAELLHGRRIVIQILDIDESGPRFGERALSALRADRAPLCGLSVDSRFIRFDWSQPAPLEEALGETAVSSQIVGISSEGGLLDYASDEEIEAILALLRRRAPAGSFFVGSISRDDGLARSLNEAGGAAVRLRSAEAVDALARRTGWKLERVQESPLSKEVVLETA